MLLALVWSLVPGCFLQEPAAPPEASLAAVREALRVGEATLPTTGARLEGRARFFGAEGDFELVTDAAGRFLWSVRSEMPMTRGYDGRTAWERDWADTPQVLALEQREVALLESWLVTGHWAGGVMLPSAADEEPPAGHALLDLALKDGRMRLELAFARETGLPAAGAYGNSKVEFSDWREALGRRWPFRVEFERENGAVDWIELSSVGEAPHYVRSPFAPQLGRPQDTSFRSELAPDLETFRAPSGHLLVPALVDGVEGRWFIFDTGAGANTIDAEFAAELGMEPIGAVAAKGVGGVVDARFVRGKSLELGALRVAEPVFLELDLSFLSGVMGKEIGGVLGYGVFARAVCEVDMVEGEVRVHDPASYELRGAEWQGLVLHGRHPCVEAEFEGGRRALFKIDTGAGSGTLAFHAQAVRELELLEGRETSAAMSGGVGGLVPMRQGRLEYFELGGRRFDDPEVSFATADRGAYDDVYVVGTIGGAFLEPFVLVLDYSGRRVAFLERDPKD